jgi:hypothetical protein
MAMTRLTRNAGILTLVFVTVFLWGWRATQAESDGEKVYVGSESCEDCHENEYVKFQTYAKKAHSYDKIKKMKKGLTDAEFQVCFECHTTGYKKSGGFRSEHETPELKDAGCEVCHGPGSLHVETEEPGDILGDLDASDCEECHNSERVAAFDYKPLIFGGAH